MGRTQLIVLSQPRSGLIADLEDAIRRCVEAAPIRFVDGLVLAKNEDGTVEFVAVSDLSDPKRAWRGLLTLALFGSVAPGIAPWTMPAPPDKSDDTIELKEVELLEISDRIPRNSSSLIVLIEHRWMDELCDDQIVPGHLVANGWISIDALLELGNAHALKW